MRGRERFDGAAATAANTEMAEKLKLQALRRRARAQGLELRSSSYGYSLIGAGRARVDDRNDLTLAEVAKRLDKR